MARMRAVLPAVCLLFLFLHTAVYVGAAQFNPVTSVKPAPPAAPPSSRVDTTGGTSGRENRPTLALQGLLEVTPPEISFGRRPICVATVRTLELLHTGDSEATVEHWIDVDNDGVADAATTEVVPGSSPISILSVVSDSEEFYMTKFSPVVLAPGEKVTFHVVLLPRRISPLTGSFLIETSKGVVRVPLRGEGVENPYRVTPITARVPIGLKYSHRVALMNPHPETLVVKEIFTTEPHLQLTLPSGDKPRGNRFDDVTDASALGDVSELRWRVPSHSKMDVIAVQFQSHTPGKYDGFLHVKTNFEDMVIPVDISVIRGGIVSTPPSLSFLSFSSDVVDCEWALSVQKNSSSWADPYPDAIAVSAVHSRLASIMLKNRGSETVVVKSISVSPPCNLITAKVDPPELPPADTSTSPNLFVPFNGNSVFTGYPTISTSFDHAYRPCQEPAVRAPESGSGSAEKLGVSRRHVLSFLTDDPNPVFGRMDLPFNAKLFDGGLAYKSTQLWFFQDPLSAQFPWFSISRCALARQNQMRAAAVLFGLTEAITAGEETAAEGYAALNITGIASPGNDSVQSLGPLPLDSSRFTALNPRMGSLMDAFTSSAYCPISGGGGGGTSGKAFVLPQHQVISGAGPARGGVSNVAPPSSLLSLASTFAARVTSGSSVTAPPAHIAKPSFTPGQFLEHEQSVYGQGIIRNVSLWNSFDVPVTFLYAIPIDPRYVVIFSPENVTVPQYGQWPDLVVAALTLTTTPERVWDTFPPHSTTPGSANSIGSLEYDASALPGRRVSAKGIRSIFTAWNKLAVATSFNLTASSTFCAPSPIVEAEETFNFMLDSLLKSAQVLYQNLTMLNSTGTVPLGNPSSVHPLHAHVARYRYAAREALCCLRGNGSMARTAGSTIAPCDDPLLSLLPRYSVSRSLCLRGGDSAFDMLMCVAAELLRVDGERFVPPNATVHPSLWASNNNDSLRVDVRSPASVLHFVRAVESTLLLTLGVHGHPEGMPNVTSLLIVTNTTSFVVPLAFSTGTFTINQNGRDYVGSVSAATTRKILHPHQFIHAPPASDYETFPVAHSDVNLTRRRQNISLFKKSRKVKSTPPQVTTYIGQMCENAQGNAVYPVAPIPYPPVIHPHWLQLGTTAYGTPVVGSLRFTNTHGMPLSIFGVSLRCELPLHTKILFHGVNTRTFPYSGWPSFVPKNTYDNVERRKTGLLLMPGDWVDLDVTFNLTIDAVPRDGMLYELPDAVIVYTDFLAIPIGVNVSLISGSWNFFTQPSLPVLSRSQGRLAFHNVSAALALTPSFPGRSVTSRIFMTNNFTQRLQILGFEAPPSVRIVSAEVPSAMFSTGETFVIADIEVDLARDCPLYINNNRTFASVFQNKQPSASIGCVIAPEVGEKEQYAPMGGNSGLFLLQQKRRVGPQDLAVLEKEEVNWENLVRSGRDVHHVILTVFTNLGPTSIALETQLYRPSLVHYTRESGPLMGTSDSLDTNDPKRKLTGVPALNALTSPERSYAHFKPVSLRLSAVDKTQGLFITVFNPLDHPLAVSLLQPCKCSLPSPLLNSPPGQQAVSTLHRSIQQTLTPNGYISSAMAAGKAYDDAFLPTRVTQEQLKGLLGPDLDKLLPPEGEPYPFFSLPLLSLEEQHTALPFPAPPGSHHYITDLGEQCCECGDGCVDSDTFGQTIVSEPNHGDGKTMTSFASEVCGDAKGSSPDGVSSGSGVWEAFLWLTGLREDEKPLAVNLRPSASSPPGSTTSNRCGCRVQGLLEASQTPPGTCSSRRLPSAFGSTPNSRMQAVIPPRTAYAMGPILFKPTVEGRQDMVVYLRNNFTLMEAVWLSGDAEGASVVFLDTAGYEAAGGSAIPNSKSKHKRLALPRLMPGHVAPELSALNCLVIEAKFGFMDLDRFPRGVEVVIPSSEFASFVDLNSSSSLFGARTLFIVNSGRMSVNLHGIGIGSPKGGCFGSGFIVRMPLCDAGAEVVVLQAGETLPISVAFIPDCTSLTVRDVLYLETSKGQVQLDMQGILPRMMGQQCIQAQYGTLLGHSMVPLPIRVISGSLFVVILCVSIWMLYVVLRTSSDLFAEPLTAKPTSVPISAPATLPEVTPAVPVVVPKAVVSPPKSSPPHVVRTVSKGTDVAKKAKAPVIVIDKKPLDAAPLSHERAVEPHITATVADVNPRSSPIEAQPEPEVPASDSAKPSKPSNPDQPAPTQVAHMIPISSPVEVSSAVALQSPTADSGLSITQAEPVPSEADVGLSPARKLPTLPDSPPSSSPEDLPAVPPAPAPAPVPAPVPVVQTPPKNPASVNTLPLPDSVKPAVAIVDSDAVDSLPSKPAVTSPVIKPVRAPVVLAAPKPAVAPKAAESAPISKPPVASSTSPIADASKADAGDAKVVTAPPLKQQPARQTLPTKALVKPTKKPEKGAVRQVTTTAAGHVVTKILGKGEGSNAPPLPDIKPPRPLQPSKSPISSDDPHGSSSMLNTPTSGPIVDVDVDSVVLPSASPGTTSSRLPASLFSSGEEATPSPSPPTSPVKPSAPPGISHPADNVPTSSAVYQPSAVKPVVSPQPHAPIGSAIRAPGSRLIGSSVSSPNQPTLRGTHDGQAYGLWPVSDPEPPVGLSSLFPTTSHSVAVGPAAHNTSTSGGNSQFSVLFGGGGGPASSLWDGDTRGPSAPAPLPSLNDDIMADVIHGVVDALEEPDVGMSPPRRGIPMGLGRSSGSGGYPMPQAGSGVLSSMVKEFVPQAYGGGGYTSTNPYHHRTTPQDYRYDEDYGGRSSQYLMHGVMGPVSGDRPPVPASAGSGYGRRGGGGEYGYRTQPPLPPPQRAMYSGGYTQQPPPPPPPPVMPERYVRTGSGPSALSGGYPSRGVPPAPASVGIPVGRGTTLYPHHTTSASGSTGIGIVFDDVSDTLTGPDGTSTPGDSFFTQQDYEADDALEPEQFPVDSPEAGVFLTRIDSLARGLTLPLSDCVAYKDVMIPFIMSKVSADRTAALKLTRTLQCCCEDVPSALRGLLSDQRIDVLVIRALERESSRHVPERIEAAKLVQLAMQHVPEAVSLTIFRSIISIACAESDPLRRVCLELLRLSTTKRECFPLLFSTQACTALIDAIVDPGCKDVAESLVLSLMSLWSDPAIREKTDARACMQRLVSQLTRGRNARLAVSEDTYMRWESARHAIVSASRTWTGMYLLLSDPLALPSLVALLYQPVHTVLLLVVQRTLAEVLISTRSTHSGHRADVMGSASDGCPIRTLAEDYGSDEDSEPLGLRVKADETGYWQQLVSSQRELPEASSVSAGVSGEDLLLSVLSPRQLHTAHQSVFLAALLEIGILRPLTLLTTSGSKAVVEASVWLLRAILALSSLSLPPTHALVTHMLPDLTQLSVMHTSRNAVPGPLPRHIVESQKRSAARAMGILRMDKGASMPIDTFSGRRAQQFVETFSSMKSQQPSTLPAVWPQGLPCEALDPIEQRRLTVFDPLDVLCDDEDLMPPPNAPVIPSSSDPAAVRSTSPRSRFPGEMRREDSGDGPVEAGQVMTGRRPQSGAFRSSQRYTAAQRLPSGLLNTITRNDLYTEDPGDLPDDVARSVASGVLWGPQSRSPAMQPSAINVQDRASPLTLTPSRVPTALDLDSNGFQQQLGPSLSLAVDALLSSNSNLQHVPHHQARELDPFQGDSVLGLGGAFDSSGVPSHSLVSSLSRAATLASGGFYLLGLTAPHALLSPAYDDTVGGDHASDTPVTAAATVSSSLSQDPAPSPFDVTFSLGMMRGKNVPGFTRRAATLSRLLESWTTQTRAAGLTAQFGRMSGNSITATSLLLANLSNMHVCIGDADISLAARAVRESDASEQHLYISDDSGSDSDSTVSSSDRVRLPKNNSFNGTSGGPRLIIVPQASSPVHMHTSASNHSLSSVGHSGPSSGDKDSGLPLSLSTGSQISDAVTGSYDPPSAIGRAMSLPNPLDIPTYQPPVSTAVNRPPIPSDASDTGTVVPTPVPTMPRSVSGNTLSTMAAKVKPPPGPPPTKPPGPPPVKPGGIKSLIKLFSSSSAASPPPARSVSVSAFPSPIQGPARKSLPESARNRTGSDGGSGGDEPTPFNYANPLMMARKTRSGGSPSVSLVYGELSESTPGAGLSEGSVSSSMAMSGSKQQDMFGLNSGTQNECQIFPGICVWRTPASNGRAADDNEATTVDRVTPYRAAITLINSSESNGHLPVWGLVPSGWHWSMPGIPKFSPEELELLSPRRALALSVFFETARRLDLDTNRESWLQTLLRQSQVTIEKDWRLWDWHMIAWLLDGPLCDCDLLTEALTRSKFMQRIGKVFCMRTKKVTVSPIAQLPWCPANLRFIRVIRQWLLLTLHHPLGRGVAQLSQFAGSLLLALRRAVASGNRTIAASSLKMNDVFTTQALNSSLTREYVALYGLLTSSHQGRKLLRSAASDFSTSIASIARAQPGSGVGESSPVVDVDMPDAVLCLRPLFSSPSQASLCRLLLLSLSYGECTPARQLLESVTLAPTGDGPYTPGYASQSPVSLSIKMFCISALQACFRRGVVGFKEWGVDLLLHVIASEGQSAAPLKVPAYHLLVELCNIQCYCKAVARKLRLLDATRLPLTSFSSQALQLRLCGTSQGFHFLQSVNLLPVLVKEYMDVGVVQDVLAMGVSSMAMFTIPRVGASGASTAASSQPCRPERIPIALSLESGASTLDSSVGFSLQMLLSLPLHVEIWADFETLSVPPAASSLNKKASEILGLTRLNNKASEMLGLRSPRSRLSLRPEDLTAALDTTLAVHVDQAPNQSTPTELPASDAPQLTTHSIPIRCDTIVDLSTLRPAQPTDGSDIPVGSYIVTLRGVVTDMSGVPKPEVLPPNCNVRTALFHGVHCVSRSGDTPFEAIGSKKTQPTVQVPVEQTPSRSESSARFKSQTRASKGAALQSDLVAAAEFVDTLPETAATSKKPEDGALSALPSTSALEASAAIKGNRNPLEHAAILLRADMSQAAAQLKGVTLTRSTAMYSWNEHEWMQDAGVSKAAEADAIALPRTASASALVSPGTTDLVAPPDLLTTDQARLSALDAAIESAAWCSCSSKGLFSEFPPMPSSPTAMDSSTDLPSLESRAEPDSGMRRERKCAPSTTAAFHFQQSPRADSVRLEQIEFELLILPSGRVYNRRVGVEQPNLFQLLSRHSAGTHYLKDSGVLDFLLKTLDLPASPPNALARRAAVWGLANIGCSERGYEAIRSVRKSFSVWLDANVKTSADLVFRATCLLAVQLICAGNPRAQLDFQALDWSCGVVCLPNKPSDLFNVQHSTERTLSPPKSRSRTDATVSELQYLHGPYRACYDLVMKLSCRISASEAKQGLSDLRRSDPDVFTDVQLFRCVWEAMGKIEFPLPVRRLIHSLFEKLDVSELRKPTVE